MAATCYVALTGSNTSPYDTWAKASTTIKGARDYIRSTGGANSTINIAAGTYSSANDYLELDHANFANLTINGAGRTSTIIAGTGYHLIYVTGTTATPVTVNNLTVAPDTTHDALRMSAATSAVLTCNNVDLQAPVGHTRYLALCLNGSTLNLINTRMFCVNTVPVSYSNTTNGTIQNVISRAAGHTSLSNTWNITTAGTFSITNSMILDSSVAGIQFNNASGTYTFKNNIVTGGLLNSASYPMVKTAAATFTEANNIIIANPWDPTKFASGFTPDATDIITNINPKFLSYPRKGFIIPQVDDSGGFAYAQSLASKLATYGFKGTFCASGVDVGSINITDLRQMVSQGYMEVASHSYAHTDLSVTGKIFDISGGTITIDRAGTGTITPSVGSPITGFKTITLAAIKTALEGAGLTVTPTSIYSTTALGGKIRSTCLGECIDAAAAGSTTINILIDATAATGYFKAEMADPKAALTALINAAGNVVDGQTGLTYVCNTLGSPYNAIATTNSRSAAIAAGFTGFRAPQVGGSGTITDAKFLPSVDLFSIFGGGPTSWLIGDGTEAVVRKNARALAFAVAHTGLVTGILSHSTSEVTLAQWDWILDEWAKFGTAINVTSFQRYTSAIVASWVSGGDGTYTRVFLNTNGDYHLLPGSSCINVGLTASLPATDFEAKVWISPDIGPYAFRNTDFFKF